MGNYLDKPNQEKDFTFGSSNFFTYFATGMQGWRNKMEDQHITEVNFLNKFHIFAVFDGHGGDEVSKACKQYYLGFLEQNIQKNPNDLGAALKQSFIDMDAALQNDHQVRQFIGQVRNNDKEPRPTGYEPRECDVASGATANVLLMDNKKCYVANAGDSRCVIFRNHVNPGLRYELLSFDHKPDQELEKERIVRAGGGIYDGRVNGNLNLSRALGDFDYKSDDTREKDEQLIIPHPDIFVYDIKPEDVCILMGCDGIWETMKLFQIAQYFLDGLKNMNIEPGQNAQPIQLLANYLDTIVAKDIKTGVGCDNMTAILIPFKK